MGLTGLAFIFLGNLTSRTWGPDPKAAYLAILVIICLVGIFVTTEAE